MKLFISLLLLGLIAVTAAGQRLGWQEFKSDEGRFSVSMPGEPVASVVSVNLASGERHSNTFTFSDRDMNNFMVAYSDIREPRKSTNEQLFDKVRKALLTASEGTLVRENTVTMDGSTGREIVIERSDGTIQTQRFFVVGDRFYQVSAEIKKASGKDADAQRFLDSFRLGV